MSPVPVALIAAVLGLVAHDLAAQALHERPLRPLAGTCPRCGTTRGWLLLSCPVCGRRPWREPLVVAVAVLGGLGVTRAAPEALLGYLGFVGLSLALVLTDLDAMRIVDRLNLRGTVLLAGLLGIGAVVSSALPELGRALLGALAYFIGANLMFLLARGKGFGYGDVKLSLLLGMFTAYVSWGTLGWALLITALVGGVVSIAVLVWGVLGMWRRRPDGARLSDVLHKEVPYGPAMVAGAWAAITLAGLGMFPT